LRNIIVKEVAKHVARLALEDALGGAAGPILNAIEIASWVHDYAPYILAYADAPKELEELRQAVATPAIGYEIHHIVEEGPARLDGFPTSSIDAPDNLVRIPTLKHWQITGWYARRNDQFGGLPPREYLRGKDWAERTRVGRDALIEYGVLKP
jgi:hypothetical protein